MTPTRQSDIMDKTQRGGLGLMALALLACLLGGLPGSGRAHAAEGPAYRLGEGDVVSINVFQRPDLAASARIGASGEVFVPMGGHVRLTGLTLKEAENLVADALRKTGAMPRPEVDLQVSTFNSQLVSVFGAVNKPGRYVLDRATSISEILAMAGGPAGQQAGPMAFITRIEGGETKRIEVDLDSIIERGKRSDDVLVQGGDIVTVSEAPIVYLYGAVNSPGAYTIEPGMSVIQVLSLAGGVAQDGSDSRLDVRRRDGDGKLVEINVDLFDALQDEDILIVRKSIF
ncbi:MAG: SLBB domain-containing protein [Alphaproteobacteria bacterium]|nr:SLBB domain-containing protein [Alphaproteobacteria bacterium]